ncbi:MAG: helix-turn-helix transcriptional regulator [Schwartzia sp.]|nr:helix-turn-helix transcriptional regulator [Schwartzia sp. (in: firmicutes)]
MAYRHIRELRESKQLTQQEIAKVLQVTQECYSRYEGGQRDIPTKTLIKLADFHNTTIDYLLDRTMKQSAI